MQFKDSNKPLFYFICEFLQRFISVPVIYLSYYWITNLFLDEVQVICGNLDGRHIVSILCIIKTKCCVIPNYVNRFIVKWNTSNCMSEFLARMSDFLNVLIVLANFVLHVVSKDYLLTSIKTMRMLLENLLYISYLSRFVRYEEERCALAILPRMHDFIDFL